MERTDGGARTEVDPLRDAAPGEDVEARRAKANVSRGLFGGADPVDPPTVGRYRIDERRGAGGMGVVYEAWDPELERRVAVKVLHPEVSVDAKARGRMLREARALARLSDPNVIQVYDVGTTHDQVFVAMEFVEGKTLGAWMSGARHPWRETLELFLAAGRGLQAAHDVGLVHRDFKPDNVLIGDDGRARVLDFGLARAAPELDPTATGQGRIPLTEGALEDVSPSLKAALTQTGALVGTPLYMSPEQFEGRPADALSDQYSFCVSLYQGLYGQRPFAAESIAALVRNVVAGKVLPPPPETEVPPEIGKVLRRGMALVPAQRHPSMHALSEALRAGAESAPRARSGSPRLAFAFVAILALGSAVAWALTDDDRGAAARAAPVAAAPTPSTAPAELRPPAPPPATSTPIVVPEAMAEGPAPAAPEHESRLGVRARDYCFIHEDSYALLRRGHKKQSVVKATDGQCYSCRSEKRKNRIDRFGYNCGGYYVCSPTDANACD